MPLQSGFLPNGRIGNAQAQWTVARVEWKREGPLLGDYHQEPRSAIRPQKGQGTPTFRPRQLQKVTKRFYQEGHGVMKQYVIAMCFKLSNDYDYLDEGDIIRIDPVSGSFRCLYRKNSSTQYTPSYRTMRPLLFDVFTTTQEDRRLMVAQRGV